MVRSRKISVSEYTSIFKSFSRYFSHLEKYPDHPDPVDEFEKK